MPERLSRDGRNAAWHAYYIPTHGARSRPETTEIHGGASAEGLDRGCLVQASIESDRHVGHCRLTWTGDCAYRGQRRAGRRRAARLVGAEERAQGFCFARISRPQRAEPHGRVDDDHTRIPLGRRRERATSTSSSHSYALRCQFSLESDITSAVDTNDVAYGQRCQSQSEIVGTPADLATTTRGTHDEQDDRICGPERDDAA